MAANAAPPEVPPGMKVPGIGLQPYGDRSRFENDIVRSVGARPGTPGSGSSRTPLESLV